MLSPPAPGWVHYVPLLTTAMAAVFCASLVRRYRVRRTRHHWWWAVGIATYGLGTLLEGSITLFGNSVALTKAWYVAGAILGGYPLAQGSLYYSYSRRFAARATAASLPVVVLASLLVLASPVHEDLLEPHRPTGAILAWRWVRLLTPFINGYAAFFLIGGALTSAIRYWRGGGAPDRATGNALIAFGALLPGVGGALAKSGFVEALYVGECIGLVFIWLGEYLCSRSPRPLAAAEPAG